MGFLKGRIEPCLMARTIIEMARTIIEMARTMFDEYKTSDRFWAKVANTACHITSPLYLHKLLKKTSYELLTGNKSNVSYFRVFGSKCYIL
jgi:hypothetical protein